LSWIFHEHKLDPFSFGIQAFHLVFFEFSF
jgi:hypothetical protein